VLVVQGKLVTVGNVGGMGGSMIGDASKGSRVAGGRALWRSMAHGDSGERGGGVVDCGIAGLEKGERRILPSSSGFLATIQLVVPPPSSLC
jgi:hypothetical protein